MMALSKCVLDRVEERKNKFKYRVYGLVEIMSRTVFARMQKSTKVYKDIFDQAVDQVFDMFVHELNEAYGRDLESSLNQHINMGEQYDLDSEIEDDLLSMSTLDSQASSSQLPKCIYRVKFYAEDGEEYYEDISEDRVEVIEVVDNDEIEEHFGDSQTFDNDSSLSENGQFDGEMCEDDQQFSSDDEELLMADDDHGNEHDQLNGLDQRLNIEGAQAQDQLSGNMPNGPVVVLDKSATGKCVCKYCDKIYQKPSQLKVHIRKHTGERPFRCTWTECMDKGFTRKDHLQRHLESHIRKLDKSRTVDFVLNQSVPWPSSSHRHNTIPVFTRKSKPNEHQVTQLNKSSNQSVNRTHHNINLDQPNLHASNLFPNQPVSTSLHQFSANLDHSSHNSNQFNAKPKFISNLSRISSTLPTQSNLEDMDDNDQHGDDQLNVLEHRENIDGAESQGDQLVRNMPSGQVVVSDKTVTGKYVCDHCGKGYKRQHELTVHIRTHTGERPYVCPYKNCAKTFADIWKMRIHHMIHTGVRPHVCEQCGKTFRTKDQLTKHTRTHTGQRPYVCPYENCTKAFAQFGAMQTHHMIHTGERPYACNQCEKACRTASALTRHIRAHTGERPYQCPHCGMSFNQNSVLQTHLMIHTGERPHVCEQCRKSFRTKSDLKRHLNVHQRSSVEVNEGAL